MTAGAAQAASAAPAARPTACPVKGTSGGGLAGRTSPQPRRRGALAAVLAAASLAAGPSSVPPGAGLPAVPGRRAAEPWTSVEAAYDRISENFAENRRFLWPFVLEWLGAGSGSERLLVAGCGDGRNVAAALETGRFAEVLGLDISGGMLEAARRRLGAEAAEAVSLVQGDVCRLPLEDASCDAVLSCAVLHHLPGGRSRAALAELARVLAPGGRLIASCWDPRARAVAKRGRPAAGERYAHWVAWRCADGKDVDRWYHLPPFAERHRLWSRLPALKIVKAELMGDNQVFEWRRL